MKKIERIPALDVTKFVMAVLVVAIHVQPFTANLAFYYNNCLARIADPMFFAVSAYCLFAKLKENNWKRSVFALYMKRIILLYAGWIVLYLPWIIASCLREAGQGNKVAWLANVSENGQWIALLLQKILLAGPFGPLWFLTALLLAIPIVYWLASHRKLWLGMAAGLPFYAVTVLWMGYRSMIPEDSAVAAAAQGGEAIFGWLANGLYYGLLFCTIGACAAIYGKCADKERQIDSEERRQQRVRMYGGLTFFSFVLLGAECRYIRNTGCGVSYGALFSLIPLTCFLLLFLVNTRWKDRTIFRHLCKMSTLVFVLHYGVLTVLISCCSQLINSGSETSAWGMCYWLVLGTTILLGELLLLLSRQKYFQWLRWLM